MQPRPIPEALDGDLEDVAWALETAESLWLRSEAKDALVWLKRAMQAAHDGGDSTRMRELRDAVARLEATLRGKATSSPPSGDPSPPASDDSRSSPSSPSSQGHLSASASAGSSAPNVASPETVVVGALTGQPPPNITFLPDLPEAPPDSSDDVIRAHHIATRVTTPVTEEVVESVRDPLAAHRVHAGMLNPWEQEYSTGTSLAPLSQPNSQREFLTSAPSLEELSSTKIRAAQALELADDSDDGEGGDDEIGSRSTAPPPPSPSPPQEPSSPAPPQEPPPPERHAETIAAPKVSSASAPPSPAQPPDRATMAAPSGETTNRPTLVPTKAEGDAAKVLARETIAEIPALSDIPDDVRDGLAESARVVAFDRSFDASAFDLICIARGKLAIDARARGIEVNLLRRHSALVPERLERDAHLVRARVDEPITALAWDERDTLALRSCAWVFDEIDASWDQSIARANVVETLLSASLAPESLAFIFAKLSARRAHPGETLCTRGEDVAKLMLVASGRALAEDGTALSSGAVVEGGAFLGARPASRTVRVGDEGVLVLEGDFRAAQEIIVTCPMLVEWLVSS